MRATTRIVIFKLEDSNQSRAQAIVLHKTEGHIPRWPGDTEVAPANMSLAVGCRPALRILAGLTVTHDRLDLTATKVLQSYC